MLLHGIWMILDALSIQYAEICWNADNIICCSLILYDSKAMLGFNPFSKVTHKQYKGKPRNQCWDRGHEKKRFVGAGSSNNCSWWYL